MRLTIWRTLRMVRPERLNDVVSTMASSPSSRACSPPSRVQTWPPSSLHPMTPGVQACLAHWSRNSLMAPGHAS